MNPRRIVVEGTDQEVGWMCQCGLTYSSAYPHAKESATVCCSPPTCVRCKVPVKYLGQCAACAKQMLEEKFRDEYEKATKISSNDYTGKAVYMDNVNFDSGVVLSLDEARKSYGLLWAWGTEAQPFYLDAVEIVSQELESQDQHEEAFSSIPKECLEKLQLAMNEFCEATKICTYFKDDSTVVLLEEDRKAQDQSVLQQEAVCGSTI